MHPIQQQITNSMSQYSLGIHRWENAVKPKSFAATTPLADPSILLDPEAGCHIDHEGFDLNVIEQAYYKEHGILLSHDPTLYKDGTGEAGATAIIQPWAVQFAPDNDSPFPLIIDHSHFVYRYPIDGYAREQILEHVPQRPELARLLSAKFKCGLDFCIDLFLPDRVEPIVHIEWDFDNFEDMVQTSKDVEALVHEAEWNTLIPGILRYNELTRKYGVDAFDQADTRSQLLFGRKSYILRPTL